MASVEVLSAAMSLIRNMPSQLPWRDQQRELYSIVLANWDDGIIQRVTTAMVKRLDWRPSPAGLRRLAAEVVSEAPDSDSAFAEMYYYAVTRGLYARPVEGHPNVFVEGPPEFSHGMILYGVACMGGWNAVCSGEAGIGPALKAQFRDAYKSGAERWYNDVADQLLLPATERDPRFFRPYTPFVRPVDFVEPTEERLALPVYTAPALEPHTDSWLAAREDARRVAQAAFRRMSAPLSIKRLPAVSVLDTSTEPFTPDMRRAVEEEVRRHREGKR